MPFYSIIFHSILFYSILFHSIPIHSIPFHSIPFHSILFYSTADWIGHKPLTVEFFWIKRPNFWQVGTLIREARGSPAWRQHLRELKAVSVLRDDDKGTDAWDFSPFASVLMKSILNRDWRFSSIKPFFMIWTSEVLISLYQHGQNYYWWLLSVSERPQSKIVDKTDDKDCTVYVYCTSTLGRGEGWGEGNQREGKMGNSLQSWVENINMADCISNLETLLNTSKDDI